MALRAAEMNDSLYVLMAVLVIATRVAGCWPACTPEHVTAPQRTAVPEMGGDHEVDDRVVLLSLRDIALSAGQSDTVAVTFVVAEGYHVQANPVPFDYLRPTRLEVLSGQDVTVGRPLYPAGKPYVLHGSSDTLAVYDGVIQIALPIYTATDARLGHDTLSGTFYYQLCDDRMCFPPTSKLLVFSTHIRGSQSDEGDAEMKACGFP